MFEEFQLITEVDISVMKSQWLEYFRKLASDDFLAMIELDKKLKPTGPASKCDGVFSIYEVASRNKYYSLQYYLSPFTFRVIYKQTLMIS